MHQVAGPRLKRRPRGTVGRRHRCVCVCGEVVPGAGLFVALGTSTHFVGKLTCAEIFDMSILVRGGLVCGQPLLLLRPLYTIYAE